MNIFNTLLIALCVLTVSCRGPKSIFESDVLTEEVLLDSIQVVASRITEENKYAQPEYRPSQTRDFDLIHTKLDLSFDWRSESVIGKAWLTMQPVFYPQTEIRIDAVNFKINKVSTEKGPLQYQYDDHLLIVQLPDTIRKEDPPIEIFIDYLAFPSRGMSQLVGAITSDQGLFFIDPNETDDELPTQIWTQGETEHNSRWFPTFDQPNEKTTQEIILTVKDKYKTLSNGLLISSEQNDNGTRTDHWKLDQPHAPYLAMIAVGDFAVVRDSWRDIPVSYFVDPPYEASAKTIFNHTPEMIEFFSERLGYPYPWPKYDQVIANRFVSGAMENTTAVIFGDFVQNHKEDMLVGNENDYIVAHELIHHWFGDLVTCESWANLTLNEGFANYGEYLWFEHKYGKDEADYSRMHEIRGYLSQATFEMHPLIHYRHEDKDDMFDAHSYNKGGLVLHMLRNFIGDEAFFDAAKHYLEKHAYQTAEVHDLRIAFEEVTGQDLNWFFDQWYLNTGHPVLQVEERFLPDQKAIEIKINQVQDPTQALPVFQFPITIQMFFDGGQIREERVWVDQRVENFSFKSDQIPQLVLVNADDILLAYVMQDFSDEELRVKLRQPESFRHRIEALNELHTRDQMSDLDVIAAIQDAHWSIRAEAIDQLERFKNRELMNQIAALVEQDSDIRVQLSALIKLDESNHPQAEILAEKLLQRSDKNEAIFTALAILMNQAPKKAKKIIENNSRLQQLVEEYLSDFN